MAGSPFLTEDFLAPDGTLLENIGTGLVRSTASGNNGAAQVMNSRATQGSTTNAVYCWGGNPAPGPNYEVSAKYFFNSSAGNPSVGVCARMAGPGGAPLTFYQARLVNNSSGLVLARFLNGAAVTLQSTPMSFLFGDEPKVTLRMQGDQLSVLLNDQLTLGPISDSAIPDAGYVGLRMASANVNQIRVTEVRATSLDSGPSPIVGELSAVLDGATLSSSGQVQASGALSKSLAQATLASAAAISSKAGLTKTLAPAVLAASAHIEAEPPEQDGVEGTLSKTLSGATLAASASLAVRGAFSSALASPILSAAAVTGESVRAPFDISKIHPSRIVVFEGSGSRVTPFAGSGSRVTPFEGSGSRVTPFEGSGSRLTRFE